MDIQSANGYRRKGRLNKCIHIHDELALGLKTSININIFSYTYTDRWKKGF